MVPPLTPSAGKPQAESVRVVIAAIRRLHKRRAAELAGPENERLVEQSARFQVLDQPGDRLIDLKGIDPVVPLELDVLIPTDC